MRWTNRFWLGLAVAACAVQPATASEPAVEEMLKAGRYREAYDMVAARTKSDGAAMVQFARDVLEDSLASPASYQRWFALRAVRTLRETEIVPSLRKIAREGNPYEQALALDALIATAPSESYAEFVQALASPFRPVRLRGLRGLSEHAAPEMVETLAQVALNDNDPDLRALAARALGRTSSPEAIPPLRQAVSDASEVVQEDAVKALFALGDKSIIDVLGERLAAAPDLPELVRHLRLLGFIADRSVIATLARFLADPDPEIRAYAAGSILRIRRDLGAAP